MPTGRLDLVRLAAVGDLHVGASSAGSLRAGFEGLAEAADVLLVAGDVTEGGEAAEAVAAAGELRDLGLPVVVVLGNHDHHGNRPEVVAGTLAEAGIIVLEGDTVVLGIGGFHLGIAGVKGFCGGFSEGMDFGEPMMKAFIGHAQDAADELEASLELIGSADVRIALIHYAPTEDTLAGERREFYPFLGSCLLGQAVDRAGADLVVHGHAHAGVEEGFTAGGIPVRNVALPVIAAPYRLLAVSLAVEPAASIGSAESGMKAASDGVAVTTLA